MRKPQGRTLRLLGMGAFTAALAFALGTTVGVLVARPPTPEALKPAQTPTSVPVSQREFADERSVTLTISATGERALHSPAQGRLTSLGISAGTPVESGQVVCAIDGRPIAALATSTPLYRPVEDGARGDDIAALNAELARLGYAAPASDAVDWRTRRALSLVLGADDGAGGVPTSFSPDSFLWIPAPQVTPTGVPAHLGDAVDAQTSLVELADAVDAQTSLVELADAVDAQTSLVELADAGAPPRLTIPQDAQPGARVILLGSQALPVPGDGVITDPGTVSAIMDSPEYAGHVAAKGANAGDGAQLSVKWRLAEPLTVSVVPPAAVGGTAGRSCVWQGGEAVEVTVVGSQLGQTYVSSDTALDSVDLGTEGRACP